MKGKGGSFKDFLFGDIQVEQALQWLIKHNPQHHGIDWIILPLNSLPVDGVPTDLQVIETVTNPEENVNKVNYLSDTESLNKYQTVPNEDDEVYDHKTDTSTFLPHETCTHCS